MSAAPQSQISFLIVMAIVALGIYRRVRRSIGRQTFSAVRPWMALVLFSLLAICFAIAARSHLERIGLLAVSLAGGAALGVYGLKRTAFEVTPQGLFYTPNTQLGIALSLLFVARMAWRYYDAYVLHTMAAGNAAFASSPLTLAVFGFVAGYYIAYAVGLLRWKRGITPTTVG